MSSMASELTQFVGARELNVRMTLGGHERTFFYTTDDERIEGYDQTVISYFPDGQRMISGSSDKTVRLWDLRAGKEIREARIVYEQRVHAVAVSRDGRWIVTTSGGDGGRWELKTHEVKTGVVKTYHDHSGFIECFDISADSKLLASGSTQSYDGTGTVCIWSLETGKLVAGPFKSHYCAGVIRFSRDSRKLAVKWTSIEVWDIREQKLDVRKEDAFSVGVFGSRVPTFWTTGDRTIVAAFNSEDDRRVNRDTICEFDALTLETVRTPFTGHTGLINGLALSSDCTLLVSAASDLDDETVKLWAFQSRQLLASFNLGTWSLILSPDARQIAYTGPPTSRGPPKICICDIPPDILVQINTPPNQEPVNLHPSDPLSSGATRLADARCNPIPASFTTQSLRRPPAVHKEQLSVLRHLRKLLASSFGNHILLIHHAADPPDPLDCPATFRRLHDHSSPVPPTAAAHSNRSENRRTHASITQSSNSASTSTPTRSRLLNWWHIHTDHAAVPVVSVPLAQGKERNATAGAQKPRDDCRPDEDFDSRPSSPNPGPQRPSASGQATSEEHGSSRFCFCL